MSTRLLSGIMTCLMLSMAPAASAQRAESAAHHEFWSHCEKMARTIESGRPAHKLTSSLTALSVCGKRGASGQVLLRWIVRSA
jgi:hypothetical protein